MDRDLLSIQQVRDLVKSAKIAQKLYSTKEMLNKSHEAVMSLVASLTNEELFSKHVFKWVGGSTLGSYFVSATSSHYDWAMKKLKAHQKNVKNKR